MTYPVKGFLEIYEGMVHILLMMEILLHRILRLKICSVVLLPALLCPFRLCGASSGMPYPVKGFLEIYEGMAQIC